MDGVGRTSEVGFPEEVISGGMFEGQSPGILYDLSHWGSEKSERADPGSGGKIRGKPFTPLFTGLISSQCPSRASPCSRHWRFSKDKTHVSILGEFIF